MSAPPPQEAHIAILGPAGWTFLIITSILLISLPISMIVIGSLYLSECPLSKFIPIYLIVAGIVGLIQLALLIEVRTRKTNEHSENLRRTVTSLIKTPIQITVEVFLFIWLIIGSVFVFKEWKPNYDKEVNPNKYCNQTLYLFAFSILIFTYALIAVALIFVMCLCCLALALSGKRRTDEQ